MYNLIIYLYQLGVAIASLFNEKVRKMWRGERDAVRVLREQVDPQAKYVWFHAASLGEFEQGRPLMEQLRREHPEYKILLTFFSPSGYEVRKNYEGADIICYLPLDTITNARRFLRTVRPVMAFFIKYEFWYNYLHILKHRGVPVYSVSSIFRPSQVFFRWYGRQYGRVLKCFTHFYVQNDVSRELLASIGITDVTVVGDTRFDRVLQIKEQARQLPIVEEFLAAPLSSPKGDTNVQGAAKASPRGGLEGAAPCFVAGSSWPPDEEIFIRYFKEHPGWKLVIAPHVIGEDHLQQIEKALSGLSYVRYTDAEKEYSVSDADVLIVNCFGKLSSIYRYADVTYVGGGFGVSIHNTVEAAVWGVPVIFGPNNQKFQEAQELKACGGGIEIMNYDDFARCMDAFIKQPDELQRRGKAAGDYVMSKAGATAKVLNDVNL
ncbi:MAG: 3-deoxy-D-manno-octulosonic acid transferase [Prevotella sp.]|nr:3-deoxy-D-manno-octulosonic acid transferase [Prevotella sp.]